MNNAKQLYIMEHSRLHYKSAECLQAGGECLLCVWHNPLPGMDAIKKYVTYNVMKLGLNRAVPMGCLE